MSNKKKIALIALMIVLVLILGCGMYTEEQTRTTVQQLLAFFGK